MKDDKKIDKINILRHSTAHVLAAAVLKFFPEAKFAIGPAIDNGFYYDFELPRTLIPEDLPLLEKEMKEIIKANYSFEKKLVPAEEALEKFKELNQTYKIELIEDLIKDGEKEVLIYKSGDFVDLCSGPHLQSTGEIDAQSFKLTHISGAYWKGDEKRKMLQRIYGTVFHNKKDLKKHLFELEEAKKRDHRKLGKELDLFVFSDLVGPGLPLFTPKGTVIKRELERWIEDEEIQRGYSQTWTPDISKVDLYKKSGHWDHYQDDMYPAMDLYDEQYVLRPMTCPHQFMIYNSRPRSYRELPLRYSEVSRLYRKEKSGELFGLIRHAGGWSFADAHIICTPNQIEKEFAQVLDFVQNVMKTLKIDNYWYRFSKWDPKNEKNKYVDNSEAWEKTQDSMKKIIDSMKLDYKEAEDEAAFYGPKLDVQLKNSNGKDETAFTVQIDFALPEKFDMTYTDENGQEVRPMIIHHSSIGCLERVMAFLIEHYAGKFPTWLAPVQAALLPVSDKFEKYSQATEEKLRALGIRTETPNPENSLGKRIAETTKMKVPYILIMGEKEEKDGLVTIRKRDEKEQKVMKIDEFLELIKKEIKKKA
jgi:threonyl-tRNA synthetase